MSYGQFKNKKMTRQIFALIIILTSNIAFCQDSLTRKNNLKLSIISLADNAKFQYERVISKNSTVGVTASIYYLKPVIGIKIEPTFRYYLKNNAPTGWYIEPKFLIGYFNTEEDFNTVHNTYNTNDRLINYEVVYFKKKLSFIPIGASLKVGHQKYFGNNNRFVLDYNFGLQYFPYNYPKDQETTEYNDINGDQNVIITSPGAIEPYIGNEGFWYLFGAGSIFYANISIGYNF